MTNPLVVLLLAIHDQDYDQPIKCAARLLREARKYELITDHPYRCHPARLTPKGLAYLYANRSIEPRIPFTDQRVGYVQAEVVVLPAPPADD